ncbi:MAG: hypothetical protein A3J10_04085 [Candidatus Sungbacteria bacterium RIFCSPLOWO2_02_FULL_54_10]|uniref:Uncharacterized protein n=2 Tax=Candidatus Sungiibacteriota TaxID=1817917 RepID=A0A1G2L7B6_9BACT|nr:MAG: hypothetical protein A2679_02570 [Candidatus Sungbacteria bacterium RIFCSPHIGHO2_01_FULL_54_26]OHA02900.1 MAG: hypothetical protein A3C92_01545 [Candidatus Sungbacteria bacterium RIFCSPHIGHO2_02_FULL_53_17]OHA07538.1 MAG: hypothetical protein A3B34_01135 [Candidatus Sungbacteria bacterium RIFCSPLOWO2_01_FULL_54_21]OHA13051.1 MAG: hypothetical protein A3J10_04085 [Candidatus Sungbacteria bacterium RIFCSPLOWO2_02_FULL_54_10]
MQTAEVFLGPSDALQDLTDGLWVEGIMLAMVHKKHSATIRVLVDMMRAAGLSSAEAVMFHCAYPVGSREVTKGNDIHA